MNQLEQLKQFSTVVADTGDFQQIARFAPQDATTNPSLVLKAVRMADYRPLLDRAVEVEPDAPMARITDRLLVAFGVEILKLVPGRVSTEVDARLSFDADATVARAHSILGAYDEAGVDRSRVLIKIASTWEGIQAAARLESQGIRTNLTLLFCLPQAVACADAGVQLISPFVGRIYDWHKSSAGSAWDEAANAGSNDPGVRSVRQIHAYYKQHGVRTEVMAASFRNIGQILALAGCDLLTISPELLGALAAGQDPISPALNASAVPEMDRIVLNEDAFRLAMKNDAMATEKLEQGIRQFVADAVALERLIEECRARHGGKTLEVPAVQ